MKRYTNVYLCDPLVQFLISCSFRRFLYVCHITRGLLSWKEISCDSVKRNNLRNSLRRHRLNRPAFICDLVLHRWHRDNTPTFNFKPPRWHPSSRPRNLPWASLRSQEIGLIYGFTHPFTSKYRRSFQRPTLSCYHLATIIEPLYDIIEPEPDVLSTSHNREFGPAGGSCLGVNPAFFDL